MAIELGKCIVTVLKCRYNIFLQWRCRKLSLYLITMLGLRPLDLFLVTVGFDVLVTILDVYNGGFDHSNTTYFL